MITRQSTLDSTIEWFAPTQCKGWLTKRRLESPGTMMSSMPLSPIIFSMLRAELSRQPCVKSHHSAVLMQQIGRTHRLVEFKHQNISAVLEEIGLPWIIGYKPKRNYQASIFGAIDRYHSSNEDMVDQQLPPQVLAVADDGNTFVDAPKLEPQSDRPWQLERLVRKFDPVERDLRNRLLGRAGEGFVLEIERSSKNSSGLTF
jgi:hypothetical protein